jgi:dienelactone hydrolase
MTARTSLSAEIHPGGYHLRPHLNGTVPLPLFLLPALLLVCGCLSQTRLAYRPGGSAAVRSPSIQTCGLLTCGLPLADGVLAVENGETALGHRILHLYGASLHLRGSADQPEAVAYLSPRAGPKPWVVVLPIWGASDYPPKKTIRWLLKGRGGGGVNILWVTNSGRILHFEGLLDAPTPEKFSRALTLAAREVNATADRVETLVGWVRQRPDTDPARIGIVGFSIGAIVASLVVGRDPGYAAAVFAMGGGGLGEVLASCYGRERLVRDEVTARFGWSREEYAERVEASLASIDPLFVAGRVDPATVLYFDARHDECIPPVSREALWEAMGRPERITIGYGHKSSFLSMTFLGHNRMTREIVRFLRLRLLEPPRRPPTPDTVLKRPVPEQERPGGLGRLSP